MAPTPLASSLSTPLLTAFAGAQAHHWPCASNSAPKVFLLFIPGNPGLSSYYVPYLSAVYQNPSLKGRIEILAVSHKGHAPLPPGVSEVFGSNRNLANRTSRGKEVSLRDQIRHKIEAVDAIRKAYPSKRQGATSSDHGLTPTDEEEVKLVLGSHSVGSYMATEVLKARPDSIDGIHCLFPTIAWIARSPNGRKLQLLFQPLAYTLLLSIPLLILSLVPVTLLLPVVSFLTRQSENSARTTIDLLVTKGAVRNALTMASEEMKQILSMREDTREAIERFTRNEEDKGRGKPFRAYFSNGDEDGWVPSWIRSQVEADLDLKKVKLPPGLERRLGKLPRRPSIAQDSPAPSSINGRRTRSYSLSEYRAGHARSIPGLRNAKATRKATGEIVIETTVDDNYETQDEDRPQRVSSPDHLDSSDTRHTATSSVSTIGLPHSFCLDHGEEMAIITSYWLAKDHLGH
ncbi:hypothetical protein IE53DRAFT_388655 [Violaceomyces palustris]|uniref:Uncharacterized protein n=1 Tax=Violaceomyces palustris TaxID=1673888 RepID=A0ACD0NTM3_9BASI|nr:hypothetical protein IE53DRAFT_388655 [Violaceomyces palustris]